MKNYLTSIAAYLTGWLIAQALLSRLAKHATHDKHSGITRKIASDLADEMEARAVAKERDVMGAGSIH